MPPRRARPSAIDRHQLDRMSRNTRIKPRNTVVIPGIDIATDIDLINLGRGRRVGDSRYLVNGRVYVIKPDGGAYPESGDGVIDVPRPVMLALRELIRHDGNIDSFASATHHDPTYTEDVIRDALELFEMWKGGT